jgi:F0F1-type ATP synthase gamma subunit
MIAARSKVVRKLDELVASFRRLRQEEITGEIIELLVGSVSAAASINCKERQASPAFLR